MCKIYSENFMSLVKFWTYHLTTYDEKWKRGMRIKKAESLRKELLAFGSRTELIYNLLWHKQFDFSMPSECCIMPLILK